MISVLIVDDYEDWRREAGQLLQERPELQIVCEVSDGVEAVQKARELKPDLIVLDIGLPKLNGIEAARRIRRVSPSSKIIFLSQEDSPEVVQEALSTGAHGYVHKARAQSDLLPAIDAGLRGEQFVTSMLKSPKLTDSSQPNVSCRHEVLLYSDDAVFLEDATRFITTALEAGDVAVVVATESHRSSLIQRLNAQGLDVDGATRQGTYLMLDEAKTLSTFMVNDMPDSAQFFKGVGALIREAAKAGKKEHPRVAICGECAPLLWAEGKVDAAVRLEQLCNQLITTYEIDMLCGYALSSFRGEEDQRAIQSICAEHSAVHSR